MGWTRGQARSKNFSKVNGMYDYNNHFDYTSSPVLANSYNMFVWFSLHLNNPNNSLFEKLETQYFSFIYHINIILIFQIQVYVFIHLNPEEYQPSGSCNFSRLDTDNCILNFIYNNEGSGDKTLTIYATNYNFLLIDEGQAVVEYTQ